jgi:transposase
VGDYLRRAEEAGIRWPVSEAEEEIERKLFRIPERYRQELGPLPDFATMHLELKKPHVTLALLWEEYLAVHPEGYRYSQFCEHYRRWARKLNPTMRQNHRAGHRTFVDYSGGTIDVVDPRTGERTPYELFLAVLGASSFTYAEPQANQSLENWIAGHVRAFEYMKGVSEVVVPDNLKSGVTHPCRYDPDLNPTYQEMAEYYGTAVIPARVKKSRDKAKVEVGVLVAERWILARLRNRTFYSEGELKEAVAILLEDLNRRVMKKIGKSRRELWETLERPCLKPLPSRPYEYAQWKKARVHIDYHVEFERHYYSVPYPLIHEETWIRATMSTVEIFFKRKRVASHLRSSEVGRHTTTPEHMPAAHRRFLEWSPERLKRWALEVGPECLRLTTGILERRFHPEQGYRACLGIFRLGERFGNERLERACQRAVRFGNYRYKSVEAILKTELDQPVLPALENLSLPLHENIRGASYYEESCPC